MIGRNFEQQELRRIYNSSESEFVMIYGRRRVGKTFMIRDFFSEKFTFSCTGIAKGDRTEQLANFRAELARKNDSAFPTLSNWMDAFAALRALVEKSREKRKVIFLDEVPWMYTQKSDFLKALEHFWNSFATTRKDIVLIVCGSASSWMVKKMSKDRGGLHNRITLPLKLQPFTLKETREYLLSRNIRWDDKTIAECYMSLGGIPYYLKMLDKGYSLAQNIDRMFFSKTALLKDEFPNLYASLFRDSRQYIKIVEILAKKKVGYTRDEIVQKCKFKDGGSISEKLDDLEECEFIRSYTSRGKVGTLYQLSDFFTLFHFQFLKKGSFGDEDYWMHMQGTPSYNSWKGLSFERLCFAHLQQIKHALGVDGILTKAFAYHSDDTQIDMILERGDRNVNILEMKYCDGPYTITAAEAAKLKNRRQTVSRLYKKRMAFSTVLVSTEGVTQNQFASELIQRTILINELFNL